MIKMRPVWRAWWTSPFLASLLLYSIALAEDKKCSPKLDLQCPTQIKAGQGTGAEGAVHEDPQDPDSKVVSDDRLIATVLKMENCTQCMVSCVATWTEGAGQFKKNVTDNSFQSTQALPDQPVPIMGVAKGAPTGAKVDFEVRLICDGQERVVRKCPSVPVVQ